VSFILLSIRCSRGIHVLFASVVASFLLFVTGCVRSTTIGKGFTTSHRHQPQWTGVATHNQYSPGVASKKTRYATTSMAWSAPATHFKTTAGWLYCPRTTGTLCLWKKAEQQWLDGRLHGSTTMSTTSDITHVAGCHSSCHYCHGRGLLLVVASVTDGWLLHLIFPSSMLIVTCSPLL